MASKAAKNKTIANITSAMTIITLNIVLYMFVILVGVKFSTSAYQFAYQLFGNVTVAEAPGTDVMITIRSGESTKEIAKVLESKRIIEDKTSFYVRAKLLASNQNPILPGIYKLNTSMTYKEIINTITDPEQNLRVENE